MRCDGDAAAKEHEYVAELIARSALTRDGRAQLVRRLDAPSPRTVDLAGFREHRDEAIGLLLDMAALAQRDGEIKEAERAFVLRIGTEIGLSELQVTAALG